MTPRRAGLVGLGLIGGSIGLRLRADGWHVTGTDADAEHAQEARRRGVVDDLGVDPGSEVTFVATPVGAVTEAVVDALGAGGGVVTDVGSVKAPIVAAVDHPRFVGGHPMAGSELHGLVGADADLFEGAVWVLTPTPTTDLTAFASVRAVIRSLGAEVVEMEPVRHDEVVAAVSHVPHLTAAALMTMAGARAADDRALLRLAAGGFRDMTRIASGHPAIWPDICATNRDAITRVLDDLQHRIGDLRDQIATGDGAGILAALEEARRARGALPGPAGRPAELVVVRVPVPDRTGVLSELTGVATELDVNIYDLDIDHSAEGPRGVCALEIDATRVDDFAAALRRRGYHPTIQPLA